MMAAGEGVAAPPADLTTATKALVTMADSLRTRTTPEIHQAIIAAMPNVAAVAAHVDRIDSLASARKALVRVQAELTCFDSDEVPSGIDPDDVSGLLTDLEDKCFARGIEREATTARELADKLQLAAALHRTYEPNAPADDPMTALLQSAIRDALEIDAAPFRATVARKAA